MNGFDDLKIYEGEVKIDLTAPTVTGKIAEVREKLDSWLATFDPPPKGMRSNDSSQAQALRMVSFRPLKYELRLVPRNFGEGRTIL